MQTRHKIQQFAVPKKIARILKEATLPIAVKACEAFSTVVKKREAHFPFGKVSIAAKAKDMVEVQEKMEERLAYSEERLRLEAFEDYAGELLLHDYIRDNPKVHTLGIAFDRLKDEKYDVDRNILPFLADKYDVKRLNVPYLAEFVEQRFEGWMEEFEAAATLRKMRISEAEAAQKSDEEMVEIVLATGAEEAPEDKVVFLFPRPGREGGWQPRAAYAPGGNPPIEAKNLNKVFSFGASPVWQRSWEPKRSRTTPHPPISIIF